LLVFKNLDLGIKKLSRDRISFDMNKNQFLEQLSNEGFPTPVMVEREANSSLDVHTHPFEAKALIISGQIDITVDGIKTSYRSGNIFHLRKNQEHSESYGPSGVTYLAGRKD
jgi:quercetin dioxygenase-like cupin family protein